LPLDQRFEGSNPAVDDEILRAIKIRSTTSLGSAVKPSAPCRKILRRVKEPYEYEKDTSLAKFSISLAMLLLLCY
jgi:hypothetical protein